MRAGLPDHRATALTALDDLLEHNEAFELSAIDVVRQLGLPLLVSELDHLPERLVEPTRVVLLNDEENVIQLMLDLARIHQSVAEPRKIVPVFLLPEEFDPHFVGARRLVPGVSVLSVA